MKVRFRMLHISHLSPNELPHVLYLNLVVSSEASGPNVLISRACRLLWRRYHAGSMCTLLNKPMMI